MAPFKAYQPQAPQSASRELLMEDEVPQEPANDDASSESTEAEGQLEPQSNGTYSESLTRLQNTYLHAMGVLDERIMRLQQAVDMARPYVQQTTFLQQQNRELTLELNASRMLNQEMRSAPLEKKLAEKNAILKDKHKKIINLEQMIRSLQTKLEQPKREPLGVGASLPGQQSYNNVSAGATTTHATVQGATPAAARKSDFGTKGDHQKPTRPIQQNSYEAALKMEPTSYDRKNIGATEGGNMAKRGDSTTLRAQMGRDFQAKMSALTWSFVEARPIHSSSTDIAHYMLELLEQLQSPTRAIGLDSGVFGDVYTANESGLV